MVDELLAAKVPTIVALCIVMLACTTSMCQEEAWANGGSSVQRNEAAGVIGVDVVYSLLLPA